MLLILSILRIVDLSGMIAETNTTRTTILTIVMTTITIVVSHGNKSVMFVKKNIFALINIQTMSNGRQKNFEDETENFAEIRANTTYFWLIIKGIEMMTLMMSMKKQII